MSILDNIIGAVFKTQRSIGDIAIQCTVEEIHHDEMEITSHPVEKGAEDSDHAFLKPAEVVIRAAWSNSGLESVITDATQLFSLATTGGLNTSDSLAAFSYAKQVYHQLLLLQASRKTFQIITGKRVYQNMLMRSLTIETDERKEHALFAVMVCKQIIKVSTYVTTFTPLENQANPMNTAQTANTGTKQLLPGSPSPGGAAPIPVGTITVSDLAPLS